MGRRRTLDVDETLSQETPEVQEELLNEIINPEDNQDNEVEPGENNENEMNNLSIEDKELCELIVRDNGSTDNTEFVIKDILSKYKFASYYRNPENIGAECNFAKIST